MPLYASGGFENGDLNDRPAPPPGAPPPPPRVPEYGGPSAGESSQPPLPPRPPPPSPSPIVFKDAESAWNWRPKARFEESPVPWPQPKQELPNTCFLRGFPLSFLQYTGPGARFGPNGEIYMLPGETPDMFECDVCGKPGHRASVCAYKYRFPPDGHIARPDWYELICWCGSLNISPDPPRKCNRCDNCNALMVRSKRPPYHYESTDSPGSTPHFTSRESLVPYFRPYNPPPPENLYRPVPGDVTF